MTKKRNPAKVVSVLGSTIKAGHNNPDLIIGSSGSAKGRGYVIPAITANKPIANGKFSSAKKKTKYGHAADNNKGV